LKNGDYPKGERRKMGSKKVVATLFAFILLTGFASMLLAEEAANGSALFGWTSAMFVAGTEIQPGEYTVRWESTSPEATVTFSRDGKPAVTVKGKIVQSDKKFEGNSSSIGEDSSGRKAVKELRPKGKKYSIVF
jgi:hypothetical protein